MNQNTTPPKPERFFVRQQLRYCVMDRYHPDNTYATIHSHYATKEEAQAVALALNALSK